MTSGRDAKTVGVGLFENDLAEVDPLINDLIKLEEERQVRRLIMIPSESICHPVVRRTMESVYGNLYAEGYPSSLVAHMDERQLSDLPLQLQIYRRYADRRFYKGTDYIDVVEALCKRRAAEAYANERVSAGQIFANVQALSGAAANLAVQDAFLNPGDTILSLDLMHGGHLSHGSEFHMSGKKYKIVPYGISPKTDRIDYDEIERLALEYKPKMIIAGYTSYPWAPDFERFRKIADACGAILMADISHPAGMAIAGAYPNPVGLADVTTLTTHKTLMGPRGAIILTTDEEKAAMIDNAVFPGEQGGPHINTITALAVALKLAKTPEFTQMQHRIVESAQVFAKALTDAGLSLAYGGTNTHLLLLDLKKLPKKTNETLSGEIAVRLMEFCGVVANKNTIPGDTLTALASGVRMGTPWIAQRGITDAQIVRLANAISELLHDVYPYHYDGLMGTLPRGKTHLATLEKVKRDIALICDELDGGVNEKTGFPYYHFVDPAKTQTTGAASATTAAETAAARFDLPCLIRVTGERVEAHMQNLVTTDLTALEPGAALRTLMLDADGALLDDVVVSRIAARDDSRDNGFYVIPNPERAHMVLTWMRGHADGYLLFEPTDITAKIEGPVVVEDLSSADAPLASAMRTIELRGKKATEMAKTVNDCITLALADEFAVYLIATRDELEKTEKTLDDAGAVLCANSAREPLRTGAKLPAYPTSGKALAEAGELHWFAINKPYFVGQLTVKDSFPAPAEQPVFAWTEDDGHGESKKTTLWETHRKTSKKMAPFAGWDMPVWYASTKEEHEAVRRAGGLFDVSHMGVFEVTGPNAADFLDYVSTNYSRWVRNGESYYSYLLNVDGECLDDIMVYRLQKDRFLVVVNAGNEDKDWAWLNAVNNGDLLTDRQIPQRHVLAPAKLRDLKKGNYGDDKRVLLAFQGPATRKVLHDLLEPSQRRRFLGLKRTAVGEFTLAGLPVVLSRTGYTGEAIGFEIFVHPDKAPQLWETLLAEGSRYGITAAGLGARDSTRTEAGLPLYGHELAGPYAITPGGAGFPSYVKFHKPFFIGKQALLAKEAARDKVVVRFVVPDKGTKPVKPGDPIANSRGDYIGNVSSSAVTPDGLQIGLGYVAIKAAKLGPIAVFPLPPENKRAEVLSPVALELKAKTLLPVMAEIVDRFPPKPNAKELGRKEAELKSFQR
jgi:glycine cleavage system T protein